MTKSEIKKLTLKQKVKLLKQFNESVGGLNVSGLYGSEAIVDSKFIVIENGRIWIRTDLCTG